MANNIRDIRRRIRSVKNIAQVTKAMEAVSAAKMRKAQNQVRASRPYARQASEVLHYIARLPNIDSSLAPLLETRPVISRVGVVLVTADRGLAGGFNSNVIREAATFIRNQRARDVEVEAITIGKKGRDWLLRYDPIVHAEFLNMSDAPSLADVSPITRLIVDDYVSGHFDEIHLVYTDFVNTLRQVPVTTKLLPVEPADPPVSMAPDYIFEPSAEAVLNQALYSFTEVQILQALYESIASEHSARMVAMRSATDAANELVGELQLTYNKARQASITNELMDIIGGSVAVE